MPDFTNLYYAKLKNKRPVALSKLIIGDMIIFNYPSDNTKRPIVLVLNKNFNHLLHGIVINYIPITKLSKLIDALTPTKIKPNSFLRKFITKLLTESKAQKAFYNTKVKPQLNKLMLPEGSPYRTYFLSDLKSVRRVDLPL